MPATTLQPGAAGLTINSLGHRPTLHNGLVVNSLLSESEWQEFDRAVASMVRLKATGLARLRQAGLVHQLGGLGTLVSQWYAASEHVQAVSNMDGRSAGDRDRTDRKLRGVPVPITFSEYEIPHRELEAARRLGDALDTAHAENAADAVVDKLEAMLFNGDTNIVVAGDTIPGLTTVTGRLTDTATNYGGGDFGTWGNGRKALAGMIAAAAAVRYYGPFGVWVSNTQYHQLLARATDGSGQMEIDAIMSLPQIQFVELGPKLADGVTVMAQLTNNVIDLAVAQDVTNLESANALGMTTVFKVLAAMVHRLKADYAGNVGVVHATGC